MSAKQEHPVRRFVADAHRFFFLVLVLLVLAAIAAALADARDPSYALNSFWLYRAEVGLAFFLASYALLLVLWLAYQGRAIGRIDVPGGGGVALKDPAQETADGFADFRETTEAQLANDAESIEWLSDIIDSLPQPGDSFFRRLSWVLSGHARPQDRPDSREYRGESQVAQADE